MIEIAERHELEETRIASRIALEQNAERLALLVSTLEHRLGNTAMTMKLAVLLVALIACGGRSTRRSKIDRRSSDGRD